MQRHLGDVAVETWWQGERSASGTAQRWVVGGGISLTPATRRHVISIRTTRSQALAHRRPAGCRRPSDGRRAREAVARRRRRARPVATYNKSEPRARRPAPGQVAGDGRRRPARAQPRTAEVARRNPIVKKTPKDAAFGRPARPAGITLDRSRVRREGYLWRSLPSAARRRAATYAGHDRGPQEIHPARRRLGLSDYYS